MSAVDWSIGNYEHIAAQLLPAARVVVDRAAPKAGDRVADIGCGTGNAALLAAERGASVTGVDPAQRLLIVARARAAAQAADAIFEIGDAAALPIRDGEVDVALSVFGLIFAPDVSAAAAELARVIAPTGRLVVSAWVPGGAISDVARVGREAVARALDAPGGPPPFPWHEREAVEELLGPHGFSVTTEDHRLAFTAPSPREYLEADLLNHPMALAARAVLEPRGEADAVYDRMLAIYEAANEDPAAFRVTSRYVVSTAQRG